MVSAPAGMNHAPHSAKAAAKWRDAERIKGLPEFIETTYLFRCVKSGGNG
ncbi:hypothetical protein ApDm4_0970 [Acetobacter pomorum]|nr:hypothetical protein ApDm4_0970 [Acetobacter pomorum]